MQKIVVAITGASGSIYSKILLQKLLAKKEQWADLSVVMSGNAREVWKTELNNASTFSTVAFKDVVSIGIK